jgi:phospholipase C
MLFHRGQKWSAKRVLLTNLHFFTRRIPLKIRNFCTILGRTVRSAFLGAVIATLVFPVTPLGLAARAADRAHEGFDHVFIIMMENTGYDSLVGNPNAPFINFVAATTGVATNYFGVSHPSQPNYIAATSGSLNGVVNDNDITIDVPNIVDQLESHGKSWKAYMQSYSLCASPLAHACGNQLYERKHNPFISYQDVQSSPARVANIVDFSQLATDLANNTVADYVWISPDQCHARTRRYPSRSLRFFASATVDLRRRFLPSDYGERDHVFQGVDR